MTTTIPMFKNPRSLKFQLTATSLTSTAPFIQGIECLHQAFLMDSTWYTKVMNVLEGW
jgi:hypothetical protein